MVDESCRVKTAGYERLMRKHNKGYKLLFFLATFLWLAPACVYAYEHPKYEIDASIDTASHTIKARQKVTFTNNSDKPVSAAYFHLYPHRKYSEKEKKFILRYAAYFKVNPYPEGFQSGDLIIGGVSSGGKPLQYGIEDNDETILRVDLEKEISPGGAAVLDLDYQVMIPHAYGRFGWHRNITSLLRWYPILSVLDKEGWHNYPFYPYHQPYFSDAAYYSVNLTVNQEQVAAASGVLKNQSVNADGTKTLFLESELPLRDFGITLSADYKVESLEAGGVKINAYYLEGDYPAARRALDSAKGLMEFYTQKFAPYPYKEFNIAPSFLAYGGTQSSNLILIDTRVYRLPGFLSRYFDFLVAHETGHQWFYNLAGSDEYREMFIDEGLNSYFILQYLENKYGEDAEVVRLPKALAWFIPSFSFRRAQTDRYGFVAKNGLDSAAASELSSFQEPSSIFSIAYGKGSKIWEMLNYVVGDEAFKRILQRYFSEYKFKNIRCADIHKLSEEEAKTDLDWFFSQWFETTKKCDYAIKDVLGNVVILENRADIQMPIELEVELEDGKKLKLQWDGAGKDKKIIIDAQTKITSAALDPQKKILDLDRSNNHWHRKLDIRPVPLYYPIYEIPAFLKDDAYSLVFGPQIGGSELGIKSSLQKPQDNLLYLSNAYNFNEERVKNIIGFEQRHLRGKLLRWGVEAFDYEEIDGKDDRRGFKLYLRKELWPVSYGLLDENDHITLYLLRDRDAKSAFTSGGLEDIRNLYYRQSDEAIIGANLKLGRYGPYPDPITGWKLISTIENAGHFLGGDNSFWRFSPELTRYIGLSPSEVLAARIRLGLGYPADKGLFQLGGENGLKGFDYKTINGSQAMMLNLEYRRDLINNLELRFFDNLISLDKIQGVGFFDVGKSWFSSFGERSFKKDAGLGLRLHFNLGSFLEKFILRLDAAQALNAPKSKRNYWLGFSHTF